MVYLQFHFENINFISETFQFNSRTNEKQKISITSAESNKVSEIWLRCCQYNSINTGSWNWSLGKVRVYLLLCVVSISNWQVLREQRKYSTIFKTNGHTHTHTHENNASTARSSKRTDTHTHTRTTQVQHDLQNERTHTHTHTHTQLYLLYYLLIINF